jgi:hypothetical protein
MKRAARFPGPLDRCDIQTRLRQVVADVAEDVLELTTKEDHGDDDRDGDNSDDECIFDKALTLFVTEESDHENLLSLRAERAHKAPTHRWQG